MKKVTITETEARNEKTLKADLKKLLSSISTLRKRRYMDTLQYYQEKLEDIEAEVEELLQDAKEGFATANRA